MKYKKFLVVASKLDKAGINMTTQLSQFQGITKADGPAGGTEDFRFYLVDDEIIYTENLDVEKINNADSMIFQTEKQLKEYGDKIPADKKANIEKALNNLKEAHKNKDFDQIEKTLNELNTVWQAASEEMYKATQNNADANQQNQSNNEEKNDGKKPSEAEVTDVDFEEVK